MDITNNINVEIKLGINAPEIAICWYVAQMLSVPKFLNVVLEYLEFEVGNISLKRIEIIREHQIENKRIDLCLYLTDVNDTNIAIVIEAKVHWPREEQLIDSINIIKKGNIECSKIFGFHLVTTNDKNQLDYLSSEIKNEKFIHRVVTIKDILLLFCKTGIEEGFTLRPASDLQQLFDYRLQQSSFIFKATD